MRKVKCGDCGKNYDYNEDDFCPGCGAYNRPATGGGVSRVDGIQETGHEDSFLHQEYHSEERKRRNSPLENSGSQTRTQEQSRANMRNREQGQRAQNLSGIWKIIVYIILGLVIFSKFFGQ